MSSFMIVHNLVNPCVALGSQLSVSGHRNYPFVVRCNKHVSSKGDIASVSLQSPSVPITSDAVAVASDRKYGSKQVISLSPCLYDYILTNVREPEILRELREETSNMRGSQMQVSPDQAQLLAMLVEILGAKKCIELGVYTGYSSLAIALVLPEGGRLVACERDAKSLEVAKKYYELAGVSHKVDVRHGLAVGTLKSMIMNGESCSYDFAFVDAEKRMYHEYFELLLQLVCAAAHQIFYFFIATRIQSLGKLVGVSYVKTYYYSAGKSWRTHCD